MHLCTQLTIGLKLRGLQYHHTRQCHKCRTKVRQLLQHSRHFFIQGTNRIATGGNNHLRTGIQSRTVIVQGIDRSIGLEVYVPLQVYTGEDISQEVCLFMRT
ncbi:hypothetical protein D9M68_865930 [compost metagenome]